MLSQWAGKSVTHPSLQNVPNKFAPFYVEEARDPCVHMGQVKAGILLGNSSSLCFPFSLKSPDRWGWYENAKCALQLNVKECIQ